MTQPILEPKDFVIDGKSYILSKFPATAGREIIALYPISGMPKIGDYKVNEEIMLKLMAYVFVQIGEQTISLNSRVMVDNHVSSWESLAKIEWEMLTYNCSFLSGGKLSTFCDDIVQKLPTMISKILMGLSAPLSQTEKPPSTS